MSDSDLVIVRTFLNPFDAELAKTALEAVEIQSMIQADDAGGNATGLWMSGVELLVRAEDAARADEVLRTAPAPPLSA
jgi:hypothetical protein